LAISKVLFEFFFQKEFQNLEDAETDLMMLEDEDLVPYPFIEL
jgi:hypothetical protein